MIKTALAGIYFLVWWIWHGLHKYHVMPHKKVNAFVISVGNLTVGGTGKTPITLFLAEHYKRQARPVGIVSRGYKGNYKGDVAVVTNGETIFESAAVVGDEPYLMARRLRGVPIVVARDRYRGCQWLIDHFKVEVILLDDGFQHLRLHRDLNLLLIDTTDHGHSLLPKGRLREPISAVKRANAVILTRQDTEQEACPMIEASGFTGPVLKTFFSAVALIHLQTGVSRPPLEIKDEPILVFCGIGNPDSFIKLLTPFGPKICGTLIFEDHCRYTDSEIEKIKKSAKGLGVKSIVTTEKDAVKLETGALQGLDIWALRIEIAFHEGAAQWESVLFPKNDLIIK